MHSQPQIGSSNSSYSAPTTVARRDFLKSMFGAVAIAGNLKAQPAPMKITRAQVHHFEIPIANPVKASFGTMTARHLVLLELTDQDGRSGFGESWTNFPIWGAFERVAALKTYFVPQLLGKEVSEVGAFVLALAKPLRGGALQSGTMGPLVSSLCAVEMALWDLAAKRRGLPLSKLLFTTPASRVQIYGSGINAPLPFKQIDSFLDRGVSLFKLKLGFGDAEDLQNLTALRQHLGSRAKFGVDVNRNWTFEQARSWLPRLAEFEVQWLEEPLRVGEVSRTGELAALTKVPISGGENFIVEPGTDMAALANEPLSILQPDMAKYCLAQDFLRLLPEAAKRGKRVVPHFLGAAPGQVFSAHLAAGCGTKPLVEWDVNENPLHTDFFVEPFDITEGMLKLPERSGIGWTPKPDAFAKNLK